MTWRTFTKTYTSPEAVRRAVAHHAWLERHAQPLCLPRIVEVQPLSVASEFIHGRHLGVADLPRVANMLGRAHATAWRSDLRRARLDTPHLLHGGLTLPDFVSTRMAALRRDELASHERAAAVRLLHEHRDGAAAFYKDTNPRNVLITGDGRMVAVDVDDLTLAPFGYDLAKLVVTLAMTYGRYPLQLVEEALAAYNHQLDAVGPVAFDHLMGFAELHDLLTRRYLGRGGYQYPWPTVRPCEEET
ncbi:phosphotransferase [Thermoactinospora rubra]|uniref:phosphotransferase n=1 Tax=Thermoactinospora rubra TaxID=1088767 RepID=UPI000A105DC7|nr:phosphotransferase [Thermoactinospora rubra]